MDVFVNLSLAARAPCSGITFTHRLLLVLACALNCLPKAVCDVLCARAREATRRVLALLRLGLGVRSAVANSLMAAKVMATWSHERVVQTRRHAQRIPASALAMLWRWRQNRRRSSSAKHCVVARCERVQRVEDFRTDAIVDQTRVRCSARRRRERIRPAAACAAVCAAASAA